MANEVHLEPCPCCGSTADCVSVRHSSTVGDDRMDFYVQCLLCGLSTRKFDTAEKAANAWNTRISSTSCSVNEELARQNLKLWDLIACMENNRSDNKSYVG